MQRTKGRWALFWPPIKQCNVFIPERFDLWSRSLWSKLSLLQGGIKIEVLDLSLWKYPVCFDGWTYMSPTSFSTVRTGTRKAVAPNAFPCNRVYESVSSCNIGQKSSLFKRKMFFDTNDVILLRFEEQKEQIKRKEHIPWKCALPAIRAACFRVAFHATQRTKLSRVD